MERNVSSSIVRETMLEFARLTGLEPVGTAPRRYLWTDAFAVCNYLELFRRTQDEAFRERALTLVDQVHHVLGRHRSDDPRSGWISGLDEEEGERHPTRGGVRIGKRLPERRPGEPYDERLEWDRDGQYYHYLTKWMHALNRVSRVTGDPAYAGWGLELAQTVHARFTHIAPSGGAKRIYWKMSIDLARPLVPSMGQHDPLDGLLTYGELQATATADFKESSLPGLATEIADLDVICRGMSWATDDPLGIGGLLADAWRIAQLMERGGCGDALLLETVMESALAGLQAFAADNPLKYRAAHRLAFRELGLAIGLKGVTRLQKWLAGNPGLAGRQSAVQRHVAALMEYLPLADIIERFWLDGKNREAASWQEHREINMVMLATSLAPEEFLTI